MRFDLHPRVYDVIICPGRLLSEGDRVGGVVYCDSILLSGEVDAADRLETLVDVLRRLREHHHGALAPDGFGGFVADILTQLEAQGGTAAVAALAAPAPAEVVITRYPNGLLKCSCGKFYKFRIGAMKHLRKSHAVSIEDALALTADVREEVRHGQG